MKNYPLKLADAFQHDLRNVPILVQWRRIFNPNQPLLFIFGILLSISANKLHAQCNLNCIQQVQVALNEGGIAQITPDLLLTQYPVPGCSTNISIEIKDKDGNIYPNTLTCKELGKTFTVKVTDQSNGNYCSSSLSLIDQIKPQIIPVNLAIFCSDPTSPDLLGYPTVTDNCGSIGSDKLSYTDAYIDMSCKTIINGQEITGQIFRTWSVTDTSGNFATALQVISLKRAKIEDIVFPPNHDGVSAPKLDCADDPNDLKKTGVPTINGFSITNGAACELFVQHSDNVYNTCVNGSYSILRTWTVVDYCVDTFKIYVQVIRREDKDAPVIVLPADMTIGTQSSSCTGIVDLPKTTATDNCSSFTITPKWQFGQGYGPFKNVPVGVHPVNYVATDGCGNTSTVTMNVTVIDSSIPVAVCKKDLAIAMDDDGLVTANATLFDDGSFDNCGIQKIEVRRGNDPYASSLTFTCNDISPTPVDVQLRVFDTNNLSNTCHVQVFISDPVKPTITCPSDLTISCTQNASDLNVTGQASATDNCSLSVINYTDVISLNSCNQGNVVRTWTATDKYNNSKYCTQKITLVDQTPLVITWPADYATTQCGADVTPDITGWPSFENDDCEQLDVSYTDQFFNTAPPACFKVVRKWVVRNWCEFNPNIPGAGIWESTQVIEVSDGIAPVLSLPADITVGTTSTTTCVANVVLPEATATDCSTSISIVNNSGYASKKNANASGTYPSGVHIVTFTAYDGCGNATSGTMKITVVDDEPPVPACIKGLTIPLNSDGIAELTVGMIEIGTTDNCTPKSAIKLELSPTKFDCNSVGDNNVTLVATDASGNSNFCVTTVNIQDNIGYCALVAKITGKVSSVLGERMKGVTVLLNNEVEAITNDKGEYEFLDLQKKSNYFVAATKNTHILAGVSTQDVLAMSKHILGVQSLDSPYKIIAADINNNGKVTTADLLALRRAILQIDDKFPNNKSWRFVDANQKFNNPGNPFEQTIPEVITYDNLQSNKPNTDWVGIKVGDLNLSVTPNNIAGDPQVRNAAETLELTTDDMKLAAGYEYKIPVRAADFKSVQGFQYTLEYDAQQLEIQTILPGALKNMDESAMGMSKAGEGLIAISWVEPIQDKFGPDDVLFEIVLKAKTNVMLSNALSVGSDFLAAEAYDKYDDVLGVSFKFNGVNETAKYELEQNMPNPFEFETSIPFVLQDASQVQVEIFDMLGNTIKKIEGRFAQGRHLIKVTSDDLNNISGMYYYQLQVAGKKPITRKMILMHE